MQFITNGPDIPDALLRAHEEGRVVFFCGAGISYPARLPGFQGLTDAIYRSVGTERDLMEQDAYDRGQFDAVLDLLERRLPGQRIEVRRALAESLKPKLRKPGAMDTHNALLHLSRNREGALRLVTTNFDRLFEHAAKRDRQAIGSYAAPMLPLPKSSRWNGVVYLHGLLPIRSDETALNRLVVTSGDFGLAYLTERWAARFVSELFRNYIVCFVGYSINDAVLRYMMDALAADRMLGEVTPQAYAFGDCQPGEEQKKAVEWKAKGVTPILYRPDDGHAALHGTLMAWAETWRDGTLGKERIVVSYAIAHPSASTAQDDFVGRMLWALSHESGLPAKRFADFNPAPTLDWLDAFTAERYGHDDLIRFGVSPSPSLDDKLRFSLTLRPAPYCLAPWMSLVSSRKNNGAWDDVMAHLGRWLTRHLNDPKLLLWCADRGGQLHDRLLWMIDHELDRVAELERDGKTAEIEAIRGNAPNGVPSVLMRTLWRFLLTGRLKAPWREVDFYGWKNRFNRDGLTPTIRLALRDVLAPKIRLRKPIHWGDPAQERAPERLADIVGWELVLAADHVNASLRNKANSGWQTALPTLLDDVEQLLRDALDLLSELGAADHHRDRSYWHMPSISPHPQNRGFRDWISLIELTRDAWLAVQACDRARSVRVAHRWFDFPYPTFKRLALFAASEGAVSPDQWVNWLLADDAWCLWSVNTHRETMRLLVLQGHHLISQAQARLEVGILTGPPRNMYPADLDNGDWLTRVERYTWLRLAKLAASGIVLGPAASERLAALSNAHPQWRLATNERDEFSHWMSGSGEPDYEESRDIESAPRKRQELVRWLKQAVPEGRPFYEDTWRETCQSRFFHSMYALCDLTREGLWPTERLREALEVWSQDGQVARSWRFFAPLVQTMPETVLQELAHSISWWLEAVSKSITCHENILLELCRRMLALPLDPGTGILQDGEPINEPVTEAINHPVGLATRALLNLWLKRDPNDNDKLPSDIEQPMSELCDTGVLRFRHGRVLLASRLITLFRVDRAWTATHLFPLLDWRVDPAEARMAWEGFLWSPRLYHPLLIALKLQFLETAHHYSDLGEHSRQFATFLTYVALDDVDSYTAQDFQRAFGSLPQEGLEEAAQALAQALEGTGDQREDYWKNRIHTLWINVWPKSLELTSAAIAESLARLAIAARGEFPGALTDIQHWLRPLEHPDYVVHLLYESGLCVRFPEGALRLLGAIMDDQQWAPQELRQCLECIGQASVAMREDHRYRSLDDYARRRGLDS
jgi:hypothetical protein